VESGLQHVFVKSLLNCLVGEFTRDRRKQKNLTRSRTCANGAAATGTGTWPPIIDYSSPGSAGKDLGISIRSSSRLVQVQRYPIQISSRAVWMASSGLAELGSLGPAGLKFSLLACHGLHRCSHPYYGDPHGPDGRSAIFFIS